MNSIRFAFFFMILASACLYGNDSVSPMQFESALQFLFKDELGLTLIGQKPVSINWCETYTLSHDKALSESVCDFLKKTFDKSQTHILNIVPFGPGLTEIQLIHRRALSDLISKEASLREFVERNYGSEARLFLALADSKKTIHEFFHRNEEVLGLVFGYGRSNTEYFIRSNKLGLYLKKYPRVCLLPFNPKPHIVSINTGRRKSPQFRFEDPPARLQPLPQFKSLSEEWDWICHVKSPHRTDAFPPPPYLFTLPCYKARTGNDAEEIRKKFLHARDQLAELFCGRKFSDAIQDVSKKQHAQTPQDRR